MANIFKKKDLQVENYEEIRPPLDLDRDLHFSYLESSLEHYPIFDHLNQQDKLKIFKLLRYVKVNLEQNDGYLFKQGEPPENFYIVVQGILTLEIDGVEKKRFI